MRNPVLAGTTRQTIKSLVIRSYVISPSTQLLIQEIMNEGNTIYQSLLTTNTYPDDLILGLEIRTLEFVLLLWTIMQFQLKIGLYQECPPVKFRI